MEPRTNLQWVGAAKHCLHRLTNPRAPQRAVQPSACGPCGTPTCTDQGNLWLGQQSCMPPGSQTRAGYTRGHSQWWHSQQIMPHLLITTETATSRKPSPTSSEMSPRKLEGPRGEEGKTSEKAKKKKWLTYWAALMGPLWKQFKVREKYFCMYRISQMHTD